MLACLLFHFQSLFLTLVTGLTLPPQEHLDYEIIQSLNPEFNKAVIRVNVFREHRQTVQVSVPTLLWGECPAGMFWHGHFMSCAIACLLDGGCSRINLFQTFSLS